MGNLTSAGLGIGAGIAVGVALARHRRPQGVYRGVAPFAGLGFAACRPLA
jgi:hypothetical protein